MFGHDPVRLYRGLQQLSAQADAQAHPLGVPAFRSLPPAAPQPMGGAMGFAAHVADNLTGSILTHSDRQSLLEEAGRRGIARFEANLIIAAVQHRKAADPTFHLAPTHRFAWAPALLFIALQLAIFAGLWWVASR